MGSYCLLGTEFLFGVMKGFWNQIAVMTAQLFVIIATKLYT